MSQEKTFWVGLARAAEICDWNSIRIDFREWKVRNAVECDNIGLHGYGERGAKHERVNRYLWK